MRLFIAIPLPEEIQNKIREVKINEDVAGVVYPTEELHITLKFLDDVSRGNLEKIKEKLSRIKFKSFRLNLDKIGFFPKKSEYIKVVWVGLMPKRKVTHLKKIIDDALVWKFSREKDFVPHVTICRVKGIKDKDKFRENFDRKLEGGFKVDSFRLMRSQIVMGEVNHSMLEEYSLK